MIVGWVLVVLQEMSLIVALKCNAGCGVVGISPEFGDGHGVRSAADLIRVSLGGMLDHQIILQSRVCTCLFVGTFERMMCSSSSGTAVYFLSMA